jgi:hypothetical protein
MERRQDFYRTLGWSQDFKRVYVELLYYLLERVVSRPLKEYCETFLERSS